MGDYGVYEGEYGFYFRGALNRGCGSDRFFS